MGASIERRWGYTLELQRDARQKVRTRRWLICCCFSQNVIKLAFSRMISFFLSLLRFTSLLYHSDFSYHLRRSHPPLYVHHAYSFPISSFIDKQHVFAASLSPTLELPLPSSTSSQA